MKYIACLFLLCVTTFSIAKGISYYEGEKLDLGKYLIQNLDPDGEIDPDEMAQLLDCETDPSQAICTCKPYDSASKSVCDQFRDICDERPGCSSSETSSGAVKCTCS